MIDIDPLLPSVKYRPAASSCPKKRSMCLLSCEKMELKPIHSLSPKWQNVHIRDLATWYPCNPLRKSTTSHINLISRSLHEWFPKNVGYYAVWNRSPSNHEDSFILWCMFLTLAHLIDLLGDPRQDAPSIVRFCCQVDVTVLFVQLSSGPQVTTKGSKLTISTSTHGFSAVLLDWVDISRDQWMKSHTGFCMFLYIPVRNLIQVNIKKSKSKLFQETCRSLKGGCEQTMWFWLQNALKSS